jgi:hypothetical protein
VTIQLPPFLGHIPEPIETPIVHDGTPLVAFADGGVILKNPSTIGLTWAYVLTTSYHGEKRYERNGYLSVEGSGIGGPTVENNFAELLAVVLALESTPAITHVYSDSLSAIRRARSPFNSKMKGIPDWLIDRAQRVKLRSPDVRFILLGGHPTRKELAAGKREDGTPVNRFNVECDRLCGAAALFANSAGAIPAQGESPRA